MPHTPTLGSNLESILVLESASLVVGHDDHSPQTLTLSCPRLRRESLISSENQPDDRSNTSW